MTTISQAREAVYAAFLTEWNNRTPVALDNEEFKVEDQINDTTGEMTSWVRLTMRHLAGGPETLGGRGNVKYQRTGQVLAQIYTACNNGTLEADALMQTILDVYDGQRLTGTTVRFNGAVPLEEGVPDGDWYRASVEVAFVYDETK